MRVSLRLKTTTASPDLERGQFDPPIWINEAMMIRSE
jgi:hypothetical protein